MTFKILSKVDGIKIEAPPVLIPSPSKDRVENSRVL